MAALDQGPIIQFFEQAFEWEQMTYFFYPYFWGRKKNWPTTVNLSDPDPLFQQFLTAGAARVVVPVPIAYVDDVLYLLQNPHHATKLKDKVWGGGPTPIIGICSISQWPTKRATRPTVWPRQARGQVLGVHVADNARLVQAGWNACPARLAAMRPPRGASHGR